MSSQTTASLNDKFHLPGVLSFGERTGLIYAEVTAPSARARVYLQGAHLTNWQPAGAEPVLFMSERSEFAPSKPIRGGVPIIFPWFGPRHDGGTGPSHGFARVSEWELTFAALAGEDVHLTFTLAPNDLSRSLGFDHFRVSFALKIGRTLSMQLTVANDSQSELTYEDALHTYFAVADVHHAHVSGLAGIDYLDKVDGGRMKPGAPGALTLTGPTDRVYFNTTAECVLEDTPGKRRIRVAKQGSNSTVVWNPWAEGSAKIADMEPNGWPGMLCIETANAGENAIRLAPGATHTSTCSVSVEAD